MNEQEKDPKDQKATDASAVTRRTFLTGIGAGAAGTIVSPPGALAQEAGALTQIENVTVATTRTDRFSRMFELRAFAEPTAAVQQGLIEMGAPGGLLDAKDPLGEGPIRLITNPELSPDNRDNPTSTAGMTFLGQFLDHDMTFDAGSRLGVTTRPERSTNTRTPSLDLDSVYGGGPDTSPQLYDPRDRVKFRVEHGGRFEDLPRSADGRAIIADPRNDENLMIAGLQVAFLLAHNRAVDTIRASGRNLATESSEGLMSMLAETRDGDEQRSVFSQARRLITWHYQWIIVNEFLPQIIGGSLVRDILTRGRRFYRPRPGQQSIPVEFQGAAYRFGHSMVRPSYRANLAGDAGSQPFFGFIFDPRGEGQADPIDLRGGARAPRRFIGWQTFFDFGGAETANVRPPKVIDTKISTPLFNLPLGAIASGDAPTSLPQRNLLRHLTWSVPSGQSIARQMNIAPIPSSQLRELARFGVGLERSTPLWYYVLKEAELAGGARLAGVGARIVGEVFLGLLALDEDSYLSENPRWRPTLPSRVPGTFTTADLLTFAGVDPGSRGQ
jgi:hypothetical protein